MTLADWDEKVAPHLHFIEAGAAMAERHARALMQRPDFETMAEDELSKVRSALTGALAKVITAQENYRKAQGGA